MIGITLTTMTQTKIQIKWAHHHTKRTVDSVRFGSVRLAAWNVQGMTLNCIHILIFTGSFLYWRVIRPTNQRFFIHSCIYLRILIISYLATFLGTNSLSVRCAVKQSINQSINQSLILYQSDTASIHCRRRLGRNWNSSAAGFVFYS